MCSKLEFELLYIYTQHTKTLEKAIRMCFGNTIICRRCRQQQIRYRERCSLWQERLQGEVANHHINGIRRFIHTCTDCERSLTTTQREINRNTTRDHRRAKAVLENIQGRRTFPQTNEELTEEQCRELYIRRERLHPFVDNSRAMEEMTTAFVEQANRSNNPLASTVPQQWADAVQRQRELDRGDFPLSEDLQQLRLDTIRETARVFESPPPPEAESFEVPVTFLDYTTQNDYLMDRHIPRPLQEEIDDYSEYLSRFYQSYFFEFRQFHRSIRRNEQQHWDFEPLPNPLGGVPAATFRVWFRHHELFPGDIEQSTIFCPQSWAKIIEEYTQHLRDNGTENDIDEFINQRANVLDHHRQMLEEGEVSKVLDETEAQISPELIPDSFEIWTNQNPIGQNPFGSRDLLVDEQLRQEIERYNSYLGQGPFHGRYLLEFRDTLQRLSQHDGRNFSFQPLAIEGEHRMSWDDFLQQYNHNETEPEGRETESVTSTTRLNVMSRYETYLAHPEHIENWRGARARWVEGDRRELYGLDRDPFHIVEEYLCDEEVRINRIIIQMTDLLATLRNVSSAWEGVNDGIFELGLVLQFIRSSIEQRAVPSTEQLVTIYPIIERANDVLSDTLRYLQAAQGVHQIEPVQPTTPTSPNTPAPHRRTERLVTPPPRRHIRAPLSETSDFDDDDRMIELVRMLVEDQSDDDDASTVTGDEPVNEMSDPYDDWHCGPGLFSNATGAPSYSLFGNTYNPTDSPSPFEDQPLSPCFISSTSLFGYDPRNNDYDDTTAVLGDDCDPPRPQG